MNEAPLLLWCLAVERKALSTPRVRSQQYHTPLRESGLNRKMGDRDTATAQDHSERNTARNAASVQQKNDV